MYVYYLIDNNGAGVFDTTFVGNLYSLHEFSESRWMVPGTFKDYD